MSKRLRKIVRTAAVGLIAAIPVTMAPCESSLQHPPGNTELFWGMAIAFPKAAAIPVDQAGLEATAPGFAFENAERASE